MQRLSARTVWYVYEAADSFLSMLVFTVTAVYYVTEAGMSPLQLVLVGTVMEVSVFVFEVPTGIVADIYSRRLSIVIGQVVMGVALVLIGSFALTGAVLAAFALWGFGYTFTSGALDAWLDAILLVSAIGFGLAGQFWLAVVACLVIGTVRNVANPVFATWLNRNIEHSSVRATVLSITNQADAVGQWTGGPAIGVIGNVFSIRAALVAGGLCMAPALALYGRAIRHGGAEPELQDPGARVEEPSPRC